MTRKSGRTSQLSQLDEEVPAGIVSDRVAYFESGLLWFCGEPTLNMLGAAQKTQTPSPCSSSSVMQMDVRWRLLLRQFEWRIASCSLTPRLASRLELK